MYNSNHNPKLARTALSRLRPTQITVGHAEVDIKAKQWAGLGKKQVKAAIEQHVFPAVLGLNKNFYIVDHHHLGIALLDRGIEEVMVTVLDDLSWLERSVFWRTMEFRAWCHPYDRRGTRRGYDEVPQRLTDMQDDPYRSLAGLVRNAGGFAKDQAPFVEFLWADFFRLRVPARLIKKNPRRATIDGVKLARSPEARYLPGWSGKASG